METSYESTNLQNDKRGTGPVLNLPAYQNDVLHALAETGGLPGLDAQNAIYIIRGGDQLAESPAFPQQMSPQAWPSPQHWPAQPTEMHPLTVPSGPIIRGQSPSFQDNPLSSYRTVTGPVSWGHSAVPVPVEQPETLPTLDYGAEIPAAVQAYACPGVQIIRIPLRVPPGTPRLFAPEDIILEDGDVVFIEARDDEFFYSAGLLGGGRHRLPRDRDLDIVEAISLIEGEGRVARPSRSIGGASVLNQDVTVGASRVIIHRRMLEGSRVALKVNLYEAMKNPNQPILIQPEDRIYLRYAAWESPFAFIERHLLEGVIVGAASAITFGD